MTKMILLGTTSLIVSGVFSQTTRPNVIYVFADQWRAQDTGYAGSKNISTPNLDRLSEQSIVHTTAVSCCPSSGPYRASLMTGTYPLTHGVFYNDKEINRDLIPIGEAFKNSGYATAYIGKWHIDGHGRDTFIPKERRMGFDYWKVRECTHDYNNSFYFANTPDTLYWEGYDAFAQTYDAMNYLANRDISKPFVLFLSWGPPHNPYHTAPKRFRDRFIDKSSIRLRDNVPESEQKRAQHNLSGYYAHIEALDECLGMLMYSVQELGLEDNTIFIFTSDHGDMLYSHGQTLKQQPWDESILVPFLLRYPNGLGSNQHILKSPLRSPDIMPSLLELCDIPIPKTVEGVSIASHWQNKTAPTDTVALIASYVPFHNWNYAKGGREYRGIRTPRYTYVRDLKGPWLLYDNQHDPYQIQNLVNTPDAEILQLHLDKLLNMELVKLNDEFLSGREYMKLWNYEFDPQDK
jgi:arylsulfatase A-like enzyme